MILHKKLWERRYSEFIQHYVGRRMNWSEISGIVDKSNELAIFDILSIPGARKFCNLYQKNFNLHPWKYLLQLTKLKVGRVEAHHLSEIEPVISPNIGTIRFLYAYGGKYYATAHPTMKNDLK